MPPQPPTTHLTHRDNQQSPPTFNTPRFISNIGHFYGPVHTSSFRAERREESRFGVYDDGSGRFPIRLTGPHLPQFDFMFILWYNY